MVDQIHPLDGISALRPSVDKRFGGERKWKLRQAWSLQAAASSPRPANAEAIAVAGDNIVAVGFKSSVADSRTKETRVIDAQGGTYSSFEGRPVRAVDEVKLGRALAHFAPGLWQLLQEFGPYLRI
jgi:hypothetical protein